MEKLFMRADEVARELEVSKSYAYKLIQQLNAELENKGFITISGRVNRQYFRERLYGIPQKEAK
ncbi:MAG: LysR family transcriptional regulator [Lachnospiraceae bacterium]|nr:LysR family transcriptional regulator [Lachnospiraceae bacterium]